MGLSYKPAGNWLQSLPLFQHVLENLFSGFFASHYHERSLDETKTYKTTYHAVTIRVAQLGQIHTSLG